MISAFGGMPITVSLNATQRVQNWPDKKRSKRLIKKLTKRLGPQFFDKPAAFKTPMGLVVHPEIYKQLKKVASK